MKRYLLPAAITVAVIASALATAAPARARQEKEEEKRVAMKDLPAAVQKTVREQSQGATVRGLSRETENGKTNYEVELRVNGHNKDVLIDPSGAVLEVEEQVTLASLPAAVRTAIEQNAGGARIVGVESVTEGGVLTAYEAHVRKARKSWEIKLSPAGELISKGKG